MIYAHTQTAVALAHKLAAKHPTERWAWDGEKGAVGLWSEDERRFVLVASRLTTGQWAQAFPVCANGRPIRYDWVGVK